MANKALLFLVVGMFFVMLAGPVLAEAPVLSALEDSYIQSPADPERGFSPPDSWQSRDPVETGAIPKSEPGQADWGCCDSERSGNSMGVHEGLDRTGLDGGGP